MIKMRLIQKLKTSGDHPYMYARVSAKRAKLLERNDYENLLKMEPNEIARNLEERDYQKDINQLGSRHDGVELVELALMRNVSRSMSELVEIAPESLEPVINSYLRRYDLLSIKRLLRWKRGGEKNSIEDFLVPVGRYNYEELKDLSNKEFEEICQLIEFPDSDIDYCSRVKPDQEINQIEKALDRAYYEEMDLVAEKVGSKWFERLVKQEAEIENLKIALRLKKYGTEPEEIREWMITDRLTGVVEDVITAENFNDVRKIIKNSDLVEISEREDTVEEIEHSLEVERLRRALRNLHIEPLGATSILGYITAKLIEIKNLRMLIRAKETGIQNLEVIRSNLVMSK